MVAKVFTLRKEGGVSVGKNHRRANENLKVSALTAVVGETDTTKSEMSDHSTYSSTEESADEGGSSPCERAQSQSSAQASDKVLAKSRIKAKSKSATDQKDGWVAFVGNAVQNHQSPESLRGAAPDEKFSRASKSSKTNDGSKVKSQVEPENDEGDGDSSDDDEEARRQSQLSSTGGLYMSTAKGQKRSKEEIRKARAERKRRREKERRNNVNLGYKDLTELLQKIEAAEAERSKEDIERNGPALPFEAPQNRVDLIARTVQVMERLFRENRELKQRFGRDSSLSSQKEELQDDAKAVDASKHPPQSSASLQKSAAGDEPSNPGNATIFVPVMVPWDDQIPQSSFNPDNSIPIGRLPPDSIFPATHEHGHQLLQQYLNPNFSAAHRLLAAESAARARAFDTLRFPTPTTSRSSTLEAAAILADVAALRSSQQGHPYHSVSSAGRPPAYHQPLYNASRGTGAFDDAGLYDRALSEMAAYRRLEELGARGAQALVGLHRAEGESIPESEATSVRGSSQDASKTRDGRP